MAEKATSMKLKVNLQCPCCYKKVKKILCKFPQIIEQVYDEKQNLVKIKVICCNPEKTRDKLCCKGGKIIASIEIVENKPTKDKGGQTSKPDPHKKDPEPDGKEPGPDPTPPRKTSTAVQVPDERHPCLQVPVGYCCVPYSKGHGGGPCVPSPPCYGKYGYGYGYSYGYGYQYGYGQGCHVGRCDCLHEKKNTGDCQCGCRKGCDTICGACRCGCGKGCDTGACRCSCVKGCHVGRCDCVHEEITEGCTNM